MAATDRASPLTERDPRSDRAEAAHWAVRPGALPFAALLLAWGVWIALLAVRRPLHLNHGPSAEGRARLPDMRLDLNGATVAELQALPEIGPAMAERIVTDREANGTFASLADLTRVPGVGERTIALIADHVRVEPPASAPVREPSSDY